MLSVPVTKWTCLGDKIQAGLVLSKNDTCEKYVSWPTLKLFSDIFFFESFYVILCFKPENWQAITVYNFSVTEKTVKLDCEI